MSGHLPGPPLVLLPGMMCDRRLWNHQIAALSRDREVLVGDIGGAASVTEIARDVLEAAPQIFSLAGLSMGGIVALEMWHQAPQRIERLALLDSNFRADTPDKRNLRNDQIERVRAGALESVLHDELMPNYLAACHQADTALQHTILQMGLDLGPEVFTRQSLALRDRADRSTTLATIDCPALVLCGEEDILCPVSLHREMAEAIGGSRLHILENCGHLSTMEQPEAVTTILRDWLSAT